MHTWRVEPWNSDIVTWCITGALASVINYRCQCSNEWMASGTRFACCCSCCCQHHTLCFSNDAFVMAWAGHYIFALWFLLLLFFLFFLAYNSQMSHIELLPYFHTWCGLSANLECMSETCCTRLAENKLTRRKKSPKIRHLGTIAQLCWAISSQLRHVSTIEKSC